MNCNSVKYTLQSKEKGVVSSKLRTPSSTIVRSLYSNNVRLSKVLIACSRLSIPANQNGLKLGELCPKGISDPLKCLVLAISTTCYYRTMFMMVGSHRKRLSRGNGGAFKNANRLYSYINISLIVLDNSRVIGDIRKADYCQN